MSFLFFAGANDKAMLSKIGVGSLEVALGKCAEEDGNENTVRFLLVAKSCKAVGGGTVVAKALCIAVQTAQARVMPAFLAVEGEDERQKMGKVRCGGCACCTALLCTNVSPQLIMFSCPPGRMRRQRTREAG